MDRKEIYSNELVRLLDFMENKLAAELPSTTLGTEYYILAILNQRDSFAYKRLYDNLTSLKIDALHDYYYHKLSAMALTAIRPGREIRYDERLNKHLSMAEDEMKKTGWDKVTSEHVLLSILGDDSKENAIRPIFAQAGITYQMLVDKVANDKGMMDVAERMDGGARSKNNGDAPKQGDVKRIIMDVSNMPGGMFGGMDPSLMGNPFGFMPNPAMNNKAKGGKDPNIRTFCTNLNELVENGNMDPIVGREGEIKQIIRVLGRRRKNNVVLVGGEGVGKTCIAEAIAHKIVNGDVPPFMMNKKVVSLDMTSLIAGTTLRGMFEERVKGILDEIKNDGNYILMIDNIGSVLSDNGKNDYNITSMLSHALENGDVQVIGTSDFKSYRSTFDKDPSLSRRFQKIIVEAPSIEESKNVLSGLKPYYEDYHGVRYTNDAIDACVELANRYITERNLPDSAIDVLDEAGSYASITFDDILEIREKKHIVRENNKRIQQLKSEDNITEADKLTDETRKLDADVRKLLEKRMEERKKSKPVINKDVILHIISLKTGIPIDNLSADDKKRLAEMDSNLKMSVIGQDDAIETITRALKRNRIGLHSGKCLFSAMLLGGSGTGKTLTAKKLAKEMFGNEGALVRFDMSEYPDRSAVNKLIGSNPGYIGYEEGGQLTETIKNKKHCVLLLDEIEKADPEIYNIFLQVLDEGFLTDNSGMKVDFRNVIILFTSNVGVKMANDFGKGIGFNEDEGNNKKRILLKQLKNKFPPEFLNRLNSVICFNQLNDNDFREIIKIEMKDLENRVIEIGYSITYDDSVIDYILGIVKEQKEYGARPIKRAIQDEIEDKITDMLIETDYESGYPFKVTTSDKKIIVE